MERHLATNRRICVILGLLATVSVSLMARDARAEKKASVQVVLEMADGSRLVGTPAEKSLRITTEYMKAGIPLVAIRQCEIRHQEERIILSLQNGDKLTGTLEMDQFRVETIFGKLAPEFAQIDRMTFTPSRSDELSPDIGSLSTTIQTVGEGINAQGRRTEDKSTKTAGDGIGVAVPAGGLESRL